MPLRPIKGPNATRLATWRVLRGKTQREMADATGISLSTYRRLEQGKMPNPPLRYLSNCAIALDTDVSALFEDEWHEWFVLDPKRPKPPDFEEFLASNFYDLEA